MQIQRTSQLAGLQVGLEVSSQRIDLLPGQTLVLYTDGVTEAFNAQEQMSGEEGLLAHLAADPGGTAAATVSGLVGAVRRFVGEEPQSDDIAVIALRRTQ